MDAVYSAESKIGSWLSEKVTKLNVPVRGPCMAKAGPVSRSTGTFGGLGKTDRQKIIQIDKNCRYFYRQPLVIVVN